MSDPVSSDVSIGAAAAIDAVLRRALALPDSVRLHVELEPDTERLMALDIVLPPRLAKARAPRKRDFVLGRHCAARCLAEAGRPAERWLGMDADGLPEWPRGMLGSISHAAGAAWAMVGHHDTEAALGIDMEALIDAHSVSELRGQIAGDDEWRMLSDLPPAQALTLLFSAKESLYKALYPGIRRFFDFSAARAVALHRDRLELELAEPWSPQWPRGARIPVRFVFHRGFVFSAVCLSIDDVRRGDRIGTH